MADSLPRAQPLRMTSGGGSKSASSDPRIFTQLCSTSALDRSAAAAELTDLLEEKHSTEHHRRVGELIASPDLRARTGGLAAIGTLLLIDGEDLGPRLSTYGAPLRTALLRLYGQSNMVVNRACEYYGELVRRCRDPDVLEVEAKSALDALADDAELVRDLVGSRSSERDVPPEARLLVAVLTLRQLTVHAPTAVYPHAATALEVLWKPLIVNNAQVRFAATDALYALLIIVAPRASRYLQQWHRQLLAGAAATIDRDSNNMTSVHGGMLALSCLLRVASSDFVLREDPLHAADAQQRAALSGFSPSFTTSFASSFALPQRSVSALSCFTIAWAVASRQILSRRNPDITRTALRLVVDLIQIAPAEFASRCLPDCIRMLSDMLRDQRCKLRAEAFITHAAIVYSLGAVYVRPHVAVLLASLREALLRGTRSRLFCPEALASLTAMAHSFGEEVKARLRTLHQDADVARHYASNTRYLCLTCSAAPVLRVCRPADRRWHCSSSHSSARS